MTIEERKLLVEMADGLAGLLRIAGAEIHAKSLRDTIEPVRELVLNEETKRRYEEMIASNRR